MAVYEFECSECGRRFELTMSMSDHERLKSEPPACPECGKRETHQLVSLFSCKTPSGY
jgi:putative FmdB family regulatory protein